MLLFHPRIVIQFQLFGGVGQAPGQRENRFGDTFHFLVVDFVRGICWAMIIGMHAAGVENSGYAQPGKGILIATEKQAAVVCDHVLAVIERELYVPGCLGAHVVEFR